MSDTFHIKIGNPVETYSSKSCMTMPIRVNFKFYIFNIFYSTYLKDLKFSFGYYDSNCKSLPITTLAKNLETFNMAERHKNDIPIEGELSIDKIKINGLQGEDALIKIINDNFNNYLYTVKIRHELLSKYPYRITSKRFHDKNERVYFRCKLSISECIRPVTAHSSIYGGRCEDSIKQFASKEWVDAIKFCNDRFDKELSDYSHGITKYGQKTISEEDLVTYREILDALMLVSS